MRRTLLVLGLAVVAAGCGEEDPTSVGGGILDEGFRTYEVVLEAEEFLQSDTTFDQLGTLIGAPFGLVANGYGGELFAHELIRVEPPSRVSYEGDSGTVSDTAFTIVGGTVRIVLDSLADQIGPGLLEVYEVTESWDPGSVTWDVRSDTADVAEPWTEPGGTLGQLLGSLYWTAEDTVEIPLDSAAAAVWADSAGAFNGGVIRAQTPGTRIRISSLGFDFEVRPESNPDTIIPAAGLRNTAIIVTPEASAPDGSELRVGGVPTWRSALRFVPLQNVEVPCPDAAEGCTIPLGQAEVSLASLLLQPLTVGPRRIEKPIDFEGRAILRAEGVPVSRSPLTTSLGAIEAPLAPRRFGPTAADSARVAVPVTGYIRRNLEPVFGEDPILYMALLAVGEESSPIFGYAAFGSLQSAAPPRLRLLLTVPAEGQ